MNIDLMDSTPNPIDLISMAMGTCYAKDNASELRVKRAYEANHMSVFEHAKFTVRISGVSRALTHQLVRHRMASYCQESQRYVKLDTEGDAWYVIPDTIRLTGQLEQYVGTMRACGEAYRKMLEDGVPAEDARYVLPNGCETQFVVTMNARSLKNFFRQRCCNRAQWEIRELARRMLLEVRKVSPALFREADPACLVGPCPEGKMSCGRAAEMRALYAKAGE